jgi:hypothetical protein
MRSLLRGNNFVFPGVALESLCQPLPFGGIESVTKEKPGFAAACRMSGIEKVERNLPLWNDRRLNVGHLHPEQVDRIIVSRASREE